MTDDPERQRLSEDAVRTKNWKRWGPYLSERQWGTVREDYSEDGNCWDYLPHDQARSRAYRWGEDGLLGITDRQARLCFALALWNERDTILKERLFGLTGPQGNHGEDVKECYYYLDSTPTHSYMKALYKYPQAEFPYKHLEEENRRRDLTEPEFELEDTGVFSDSRYYDIFAEYAKASPNNICIKISVVNRGPDTATIHVLPTLWYRNTWIWGCSHEGCTLKPNIVGKLATKVRCTHQSLPPYYWEVYTGPNGENPELLFTENEINTLKMYGVHNYTPYVKDAFNRFVINGERYAVSNQFRGSKVAAHYILRIPPGKTVELRSRLYQEDEAPGESFGSEFERVFQDRKHEADVFYGKILPHELSKEEYNVARQAFAGLLWSKQFFHYVVKDWLHGDRFQPPPPEERKSGRNCEWGHLFNRDVISMPDKWEYPWYASWDLAFHMLPFACIDLEFSKQQLILFLREWYMHPNGQIPAYEFAFDDVNPPVHAWAVLKVFKATGRRGERDHTFLARCFQKLILNFTWWVNRKDPNGKNVFTGGFLGLDNIGVFDRSKPLPFEGELEQADGTAWMAFFCLTMLDISLELAEVDPSYADMASKFFEHFILIADAINSAGQGEGLWDAEDGFYYDFIRDPEGNSTPMRIRSVVGIVPLFGILVLDGKRIGALGDFFKRCKWFMENRKDLTSRISYMTNRHDGSNRYLLAIPTRDQLMQVLKYVLDEEEFLSPYGIRSLSKIHEDKPFKITLEEEEQCVYYLPGESESNMFGGNSNWRGPIWLCMNFLLIEALERYYYYYGEELKVECPTRSGKFMTLKEVAKELAHRILKLFLPDENGRRPCHGTSKLYASDPHWKDLILFYEYFHGDSGRGCGASHQTGWTALVVNCLMVKFDIPHAGLALYNKH